MNGQAGIGSAILIDEDVEEIRLSMKRFLEKRGYRVQSSSDEHEALEKIKISMPDAILTDLDMPSLDDLTRLVREDEFCCDLPIIVIEMDNGKTYARENITVINNLDQLDDLMKHLPVH